MSSSVKSENLFQKKSCVVVCGASRGLGECISITFAKKFLTGSVFILLSRDGKALENVKTSLQSECPDQLCITKVFDQGIMQQENFECLFDGIVQSNNISLADLEQVVMVHCAGTLGDITKYCKEMTDPKKVRENFDINVVGTILLNSAFLKAFKDVGSKVIINISSLAGIQPFKSWSLYCSGKAARDMFFRTLALEEPDILVLNYAPGPCATDMQKDCREQSADPETKQMFIDALNSGGLLSPQTSIDKLCEVLTSKFESGAHIDFYDEIKQ